MLAAISRALGLDPVDLLQAAMWELEQWPLPGLGLLASDVARAV